MANKVSSSAYIDKCRRDHALHVIQDRAIPALSDGLKTAERRVMWTARDGKKWKSAALAGACMSIHPHAAPEGSVDVLAGFYKNNIPLMKGIGTFGTRLNPTGYGASRYTSVIASDFAKDVLYRDIEIIPLKDNYDMTLQEPVHFLPLVPLVLLNPTEGVAIGFSCNILPRDLADIIKSQLKYLNGVSERTEPTIKFKPTSSEAVSSQLLENGNRRWEFEGSFERITSSKIRVTNLPYGTSHSEYIETLDKMKLDKRLVSVVDDSSNEISIVLEFPRGTLTNLSDQQIVDVARLRNFQNENMNVVDLSGDNIISLSYKEVIHQFTEWRLGFYVPRYQRLLGLLEVDVQRYKDILLAIDNNAGTVASNKHDRDDFKRWLSKIGVIHLDFIASLPVYRFTKDEKKAVEQKLADGLKQMQEYKDIIKSVDKRKEIYKSELNEILKQYGK